MDAATNIFLWISRFTTIMSQCRGSPRYQVRSKIAGTEILLISETFRVLILTEAATEVLKKVLIFTGKHLYHSLFFGCNFIK